MKNKLFIIIIVALICLIAGCGFYAFTLRQKNDRILKQPQAVKCPEVKDCTNKAESETQDKISPVSAGPETLGGYKVAQFLDLGSKDLYMLVENTNEYEALYCGANGKEVTGDYYLYFGTENGFSKDKMLSLGNLKFDSQNKNLFREHFSGQTRYVSVAQYNSCNNDTYRLWLIRDNDTFAPVSFNYGDVGENKTYDTAGASFGHFEVGENSLQIWSYLGAQPGDEADRTYYFKLYEDRAWVNKIVTNYADNITGYEIYRDFEMAADKTSELWSFKVPTNLNVNYNLRNMMGQLQVMMDDNIMFELASGNKIDYSVGYDYLYKQAEYDGLGFYLYVYDMKYEWQDVFLNSFTIDGKQIFKAGK